MTHSIVKEQNTTSNIERLAAQRELYSEAKTYMALAFFFSVPLMILLSTVVLALNTTLFMQWGITKQDYSWVIIMTSFIVLILNDAYLIPNIKEKINVAARIQELFDTAVLAMPWNEMAGDKPDPETIKHYADKHLDKPGNLEDLENWYSKNLDQLPFKAARIISQRSNFSWDSELRKRYVKGLYFIVLLMVVVAIVGSSIANLPMKQLWTMVLATLMPAIVFLLQQIRDHRQTITDLDRFKSKTEAMWQRLLKKNEPTDTESRQLQDELFNLRRSNPLIFDWIYNRAKKGQEEGMYYSVKQSISEYTGFNSR